MLFSASTSYDACLPVGRDKSVFATNSARLPPSRDKSVILFFRMFYFVYILRCGDDGLYTGCTRNLEERLQRHRNGYVPATAGRLSIELITYIVFTDKYKAFEFEKYLKSGSGRAFIKKHLI